MLVNNKALFGTMKEYFPFDKSIKEEDQVYDATTFLAKTKEVCSSAAKNPFGGDDSGHCRGISMMAASIDYLNFKGKVKVFAGGKWIIGSTVYGVPKLADPFKAKEAYTKENSVYIDAVGSTPDLGPRDADDGAIDSEE